MLYTRKNEKHNSVPQSQYNAVWFLISMCFMKTSIGRYSTHVNSLQNLGRYNIHVNSPQRNLKQPKILTGAKSHLANK